MLSPHTQLNVHLNVPGAAGASRFLRVMPSIISDVVSAPVSDPLTGETDVPNTSLYSCVSSINGLSSPIPIILFLRLDIPL